MNNQEDNYIFSPKLIVEVEGLEPLNDQFILRPLHIGDHKKGFLSTLAFLTKVPDVPENAFIENFKSMQSVKDHYYIIAIEDKETQKIVAIGTLLVEKKFSRGITKCGHIEDIVVNPDYRQKKFGKRLVKQLMSIGKVLGCYKIILDCTEQNVPFYEKCDFEKKEVQMALLSVTNLNL